MSDSINKITEQPSEYRHLEQKSTRELLKAINQEDKSVPHAVEKVIPQVEALVDVIVDKMLSGGRLFYIGSGTSGRLGIVDASECPPTFGVEQGLVIGLIAGGDQAIRKAKEFAEDDPDQGWQDLKDYDIEHRDVVVGLSTSGTTPYVVGALERCQQHDIITGAITCNENTPLARAADHPIEVLVGPEFVTGSTRMKGGTAEKLILNMLSTTVMIHLGRVKDNKMVDMQLSNEKLIDRGTRMIIEELGWSFEKAQEKLLEKGSVRAVLESYK